MKVICSALCLGERRGSSGHLVLAAGAPEPVTAGIWQGLGCAGGLEVLLLAAQTALVRQGSGTALHLAARSPAWSASCSLPASLPRSTGSHASCFCTFFFFFFPSKIQQISVAESFKRIKWELNHYLRGLSKASWHLAGAENQLQPPSASQRVLLVYLKALGEVLQRQGQTHRWVRGCCDSQSFPLPSPAVAVPSKQSFCAGEAE